MTERICLTAISLVALTLGAMFVLVLVVVHKTIRDMSFFDATSTRIVAVCVATLAVVGLVRFSGPSEHAPHAATGPGRGEDLIDLILLPYATLALVLLFFLVLLGAQLVIKRCRPADGGANTAIKNGHHGKSGGDPKLQHYCPQDTCDRADRQRQRPRLDALRSPNSGRRRPPGKVP
jgi:hypothetical protein